MVSRNNNNNSNMRIIITITFNNTVDEAVGVIEAEEDIGLIEAEVLGPIEAEEEEVVPTTTIG